MRKVGSLVAVFAAVVVGAACGSSGSHGYDPSQDAPGSGEGGAGGDGGNGSSPDGGGFGTTDAQAGIDPDAACAKDTQHATQAPLDLYIMLDTSGSMAEKTTSGATKYESVKGALNAFVADNASKGIGVGLQFFPQLKPGVPTTCTSNAQCGVGGPCLLKACASNIPILGVNPTACDTDGDCFPPFITSCQPLGQCAKDTTIYCFLGQHCVDDFGNDLGDCAAMTGSFCLRGDSCDGAQYSAPAVSIGALPGAGGSISGALATKTPFGGTPTLGALQGAVDQAKQYATANSGHSVVAVLVTDGFPSECGTNNMGDIGEVAAVASSALGGSPSVKTFVIGVFTPDEQAAAQNNLNQIASAGGTKTAFVITTSQNVEQQFLQALTALRGTALPCEYTLPVPKSGTPDYTKVNVQYSSGGGAASYLPNVSGSGACTDQGGWYYDVSPPSTPTKIELCPASCDSVKKDANATVDVIQGCKTYTK